ncbi:MAG: aldo/keto reductase, partial [Gemmatimonadaceae bacterium]
GKRAAQLTDARLESVEALREFAQSRSHTLLELAFSWLLAHPIVASVIAGATTPDQVTANVAAATWTLDPSDMAAVDAITPM